MKQFIMTILLAFHCAAGSAQFYTIADKPHLYKIQTEADASLAQPSSASRKTQEDREDSPLEDANKNDAASTDERKGIIAQYLSVSYPLKKIKISSHFGKRKDPFTGKKSHHNGIDLQARNTEAYSIMDGKVIKVGHDKRSGNYVTLQYGGYTISYCHLTKTLVSKGDIVRAGDVVAITGNTGRSTGPHLHLTCKFNGNYINPCILLDYVKETRAECMERLKNS